MIGKAAAVGLALVLAGLAAAPASGQYPGGDHRCFDDHHSERCRLLRVEKQQDLYDLPPIEDLQRDGVQVRRAFYVMGGHPANVGALTFSRRRGAAPRVEFRTPRRGGRVRIVSAEVPEEVWRAVLERSAGFERIVGGRDPEEICMHPSFYNVEAADPPARGRPGAVAVRQDSICPVTRATEVAFHLADVALRHIPRCAPLREAIDITFSALALCTRLPSAAAAEAYAALVVLLQWGNDDEAGVRAAFAETVRGRLGRRAAGGTRSRGGALARRDRQGRRPPGLGPDRGARRHRAGDRSCPLHAHPRGRGDAPAGLSRADDG